VIGRFATQFNGYRQHDSQELTAFLVDGLHEDLNRVLDKKYTEVPDQDETVSDNQLADEAWERHLLRNRSVIVDLFQGQLKSAVTCPQCGFISRTFDPLMFLSVPIPTTNVIKLNIIYVPKDFSMPRKYFQIEIEKNSASKVQSLIEDISRFAEVNPNEICLVEMSRGNINRKLDERGYLYNVSKDNIFAFQIEPANKEAGEKLLDINVIHRQPRQSSISGMSIGYNIMGEPFYTSLAASDLQSVTHKKIFETVSRQLQFYVNPESENQTPYEIYLGTNVYDSRAVRLNPESDDLVEVSRHQNKICVLVTWTNENDYNTNFGEVPAFDENADDESNSISLESCLQLFTKSEQLGKGDEWYCPRCKEFHQASKKFSLWKTPQYLIVHLKRFSQGRSAYSGTSKIDSFVQYPLEGLDLSEYIENDSFKSEVQPIYDLYGVSVHSGGLGGGHYTAYGLNPIDNQWYSFNDSSTSQVGQNRVVTSGAYLLFYKLRDLGNELATVLSNNSEGKTE